MDTTAKADEFIALAEKSLKKWSIFSGNQKYEDAAEYYNKAATQVSNHNV